MPRGARISLSRPLGVPRQPRLEVVLPAGGVKDYVGNGIANEFVSRFTTRGP